MDTDSDPSESVEDNIRKLDFAQDVRDKALHYIEMARSIG